MSAMYGRYAYGTRPYTGRHQTVCDLVPVIQQITMLTHTQDVQIREMLAATAVSEHAQTINATEPVLSVNITQHNQQHTTTEVLDEPC